LIFRSGNSPGTSHERYFDFSLLPIVEDSGIAEGVLEITVEQTENVINGRRMDTLNRLSNSLKNIQDFDGEFWARVVEAFDENKLDSPMLILYRTTSSFNDNVQHLEQALGVTPGGVFAPYLCFDTGVRATRDLFHAEMHIAKQQNKVVIKEFPAELRANAELVSRGFAEPPSGAAIIPIQVTASCTRGFLILGLNPKRPLDESYKFWFECIRKEIAAAATGVWLRQQEMAQVVERERQRGMKQLTENLRNELSRSAEALRHSEVLFRQVAEILPVALLLMDLRGKFFYTNPTACYMYRVKDHDEMNKQWAEYTYHEDRQAVLKFVDIAVKTKSSICMHHRIGNDNPERGWECWVAASICVQEDEETGEVLRFVPWLVMGDDRLNGWLITIRFIITLVDITSHKQNEEYQRQLSTQAVERRRQQENFIDIFSHELLNPFSATLQCADSILASLTKFQNTAKPLDIDELIDSAQTILVCVQHQKRIIDDVLTLSKLESMALTVVPISVRLHENVAQMMKIFHSELQAKRIGSTLVIENSYKMLDIDWVMADPSRFSQVLVNLLTNAIKFSSPMSSARREITVRLGASKERPLAHGNVQYRTFTTSAEADASERSQCVGADWGEGEPLYIQATVEDTGIGISKKWQAKLFQRFEQVPKTHVTYGGSGLGLFICRRLCRIQGGEIGFWSEEGKGSQFAFFIKVYRSETPAAEEGQQPMELASLRSNSGDKDTPTVLSLHDIPGKSQAPAKPTAYRVLIVEDNLINQEVLRRQLKNEGCVTHVANDGQQALDFVRASSFSSTFSTGKPGEKHGERLDIILMDMEMPIMDGCTATRKIRELEQSGELIKHVPIVGISANARPEQIAMMTEAGMDDAIPKPFRIPHLLERFAVVMKKLSVEVTPIVSRRGSEEIERVGSRDGKESSTPASGSMSTSSTTNPAAAGRDGNGIACKRREAPDAGKRDGKRHQAGCKDVIQNSNPHSPKPGVKKENLQAPKIPKAPEPPAPPTPDQLQFKLEQLSEAENLRGSDSSGYTVRAGTVTSPSTGRTATQSRANSRSVSRAGSRRGSRAGSRRSSDVSPRTMTPRVSEAQEEERLEMEDEE
jgi:PAS domain S-box-containing protein